MTGLEKIVQKIIADAEEKAQLIIERANEYVKEQEADTDKQRTDLISSAVNQAKRDAEVLEVRMNSLAEASQRKADLEQRRQIIADTVEQALQNLADRSAEEKVKLYSQLIENSKLSKGTIHLCEADQAIMDDLLTVVGSAYRAGESADIRGGVIIREGDITENLSYDLVIRNYMPELSALAASYLFTQEH